MINDSSHKTIHWYFIREAKIFSLQFLRCCRICLSQIILVYIKMWQTRSSLSNLSRQWCNQRWTSGALSPFLWVQGRMGVERRGGKEGGEEGMKDVTWVFVWQFFLSVSSPLLAALINNINQSLMSAQLDPGSAPQQPNKQEPQVHKYESTHKIACIKQEGGHRM